MALRDRFVTIEHKDLKGDDDKPVQAQCGQSAIPHWEAKGWHVVEDAKRGSEQNSDSAALTGQGASTQSTSHEE